MKKFIKNIRSHFHNDLLAQMDANKREIINIIEASRKKTEEVIYETHDKNKMENIFNIIHKIETIHLHGRRISDYLAEQGIKSITLIGNLELIKIIGLDFLYSDEVLISQVFADEIETTCNLYSLIRKSEIKKTFEEGMKIIDNSVLICTAERNEQYKQKILNIKKCKIIELPEIIEDWYDDSCYYLPLQRIKDNNVNTPVCILHHPILGEVKNKSDNERNMIENGGGIEFTREMLRNQPPVIPEALKKYTSDLEYAKSVTDFIHFTKRNSIFYLGDKQSQFVNVIEGCRATTDQPQGNNDGIVYVFGHSVIIGIGTEDKDTISSNLQRFLNKYAMNNNKSPKLVINCGNFSYWNYFRMFNLIKSIKFNKNDVIIVPMFKHSDKIISEEKRRGFIVCETQYAFERPHNMGEVFIDNGVHINAEGSNRVAECIFKTFEEHGLLAEKCQLDNTHPHIEQANEYAEELHDYKTMLSQTYLQIFGKNGSIVMNCNPFTLGHRYLIEFASERVRHLFIFIVEEDKSFFPFSDRLYLAKDGTKELSNVTVLPSGKFIISALTFADYFDKAEFQNKIIDPSMDVTLFAKEIAPALNITVRFAGEEPLDNVTKQYNVAMRRILPNYGIEFVEIQRKEFNAGVISASKVRKMLEDECFEEIHKFVPQTTLDYLKQKYLF